MAEPRGFDVLVLGSGASGLAAPVSAELAGARLARARRRAFARGLHRRPRRGGPLLRRRRGARRALDQPSRRDRRGDADRPRRGCAGAGPRRAPVPPERRRVARVDAGLLDPGDDPRVRRRAPQRRRRGVHRFARPARRRQPGDRRRGRKGQGRRDGGRPLRGLPRHDAHRRARRGALAPVHAAALPRGGNRPADGEDPHLPRPPLPERRPRHRPGRRDDARGSVRLRRDRRWHARAQPHDGQLAARVCRLRTARRQGSGGESESMSIDTTTELQHAGEDAAAHLYVSSLTDIPQDLRDALKSAAGRETSVAGQRVLNTILRNVEVADGDGNLVCQDTGLAVYTCYVGEHFPLHPVRIYEALRDGTARATVEHPLRSNAVHTITRENTGPNIGHRLPIVHWEFVKDWDGLDVKCVPKGSGSENMSFLKMCVPADGVKGIKQFVLESIVGAGGKPCPPGIVGVGIGGSADYAMYLAKEAITRPIGTRNADPIVAQLEDELMGLLNETGIGPMGLGGDVTVLNCHIEHADTHMTLNPVAVNYQCWAARRATAHIAADGSVEMDREAYRWPTTPSRSRSPTRRRS